MLELAERVGFEYLPPDPFAGELVGRQLPRLWTPLPEHVPSDGAAILELAGVLGLELDPWQALVLMTAAARDPAHLDWWWYRLVTLLVARQSGKTQIARVRIAAGLFVFDEPLILHTAQDRAVPRASFLDLAQRIEETPHLKRACKPVRHANGQETIETLKGATYQIKAPRAGSSRSWTCSLLVFDEAREQHDRDLWAAAVPTVSAVPGAQVWALSNAGDAASVVLNDLRDDGRDAAARAPGYDPHLAYFEWSASPTDEGDLKPIDDRSTWPEANPGLGYRVTERAIEFELRSIGKRDPDGFRTERLCQWVTGTERSAIPWDRWARCGGLDLELDDDELRKRPRAWAGVHVDGELTHAALAVVLRRDGRLIADLVREWRDPAGIDLAGIVPEALEVLKTLHVQGLAYDRASASVIGLAAEDRRIGATRVDAAGYVTSSAALLDAVRSRTLWHRDDPALTAQVVAARRKDRGDGTWYISQGATEETVSGALALAYAVELAYRPSTEVSIH